VNDERDKPASNDADASNPSPKSGEGAATALQALIRKRKLEPPGEPQDNVVPAQPS
jgi:hypothetical protein